MGTTSEKLTYLNETKQELKQAINNLGGSITDETTFRQYANQLQNVYDNLPKTEYQEGTEINLGKTIKGKLDYDNGVVGIGQSSQDGTPTPSQEIPIKCVTGNQDVVVSGKNKFNINATPILDNIDSYSVDGSKLTQTNSSQYGYARTVWLIDDLKAGKQYKLSFKFINPNASAVQGRIYNSANTSLVANTNYTIDTTGTLSVTFTAAETSCYLRLYSNTLQTANGYSVTFDEIQLEQNSSATTYEPYITPKTHQLSLGDIQLNAIGNYKDELIYDVDEDKVYKYEKIKEINIDGTQGSFSKPNTNRFNIDGIITDYKKLYGAILCMSNYYKAYAQRNTNDEFNADVVNTNYAIELTSNAGANAIRIKDTRYDDITQYQTWLSNNIITFYYVLATPVETEITDTNLHNQVKALYNAHSLNGTTIITSNGNLPMIIKVRALKGE